MRALAALAATAMLTACAPLERAELAARAPAEMAGMSKAELLGCAGPPHRSYRMESLEIFAYTRAPSAQVWSSGGQLRSDARDCTVTVELHEGVVHRVSYSGATGGLLTQHEQCGYLVGRCLGASGRNRAEPEPNSRNRDALSAPDSHREP